MRSWPQLSTAAARLDIEIRETPGKVELLDVASLAPLVTITLGQGLHSTDRSSVLRAAVSGILTEIRRRGA